MKRCAVAVLVLSLAAVAFGGVASQARADINIGNVQLCVNGGWRNLMRANGTAFQSQFHCVQYAVSGGVIYPLLKFSFVLGDQPGADPFCSDNYPPTGQPDDGICTTLVATGLKPGTNWMIAFRKNGSFVVGVSNAVPPSGNISVEVALNVGCQVGDVWTATATGTSANSVSTPTQPGQSLSQTVSHTTTSCPT
jgi:hypothetical protein